MTSRSAVRACLCWRLCRSPAKRLTSRTARLMCLCVCVCVCVIWCAQCVWCWCTDKRCAYPTSSCTSTGAKYSYAKNSASENCVAFARCAIHILYVLYTLPTGSILFVFCCARIALSRICAAESQVKLFSAAVCTRECAVLRYSVDSNEFIISSRCEFINSSAGATSANALHRKHAYTLKATVRAMLLCVYILYVRVR